MATKDKPNNKNLRALFSVICLCIVALGLIVYFSTNSAHTTDVNEATTVVDKAKDKEKKITTQPSTALTTQENTQVQTTKKSENKKPTTVTSTEVSTMTSSDTNIPYKSFYKYPCDETVLTPYSEELVKNKTMNDGLVLSVTKDAMLGTVIEIDHGSKLVARYCGMDTVNVSEGDYVTIGEVLGTLGTTPFEEKSESHLHFETLLDNKYVNPLNVMGKTE